MYTFEEHLDNLIRHIELVREACILMGKRLIAQGRKDHGRLLIMRGHMHDVSKFTGIEFDYLHVGPDVNQVELEDMQELVGGYIEPLTFEGFTGYVNEEGKMMGLIYNELATTFCFKNNLGLRDDDYIVGNLLLLGPIDENGDDTDVPHFVQKNLGF